MMHCCQIFPFDSFVNSFLLRYMRKSLNKFCKYCQSSQFTPRANLELKFLDLKSRSNVRMGRKLLLSIRKNGPIVESYSILIDSNNENKLSLLERNIFFKTSKIYDMGRCRSCFNNNSIQFKQVCGKCEEAHMSLIQADGWRKDVFCLEIAAKLLWNGTQGKQVNGSECSSGIFHFQRNFVFSP